MRCLAVLLTCGWLLSGLNMPARTGCIDTRPWSPQQYPYSFEGAKTWEEREFERVMRLRTIHAGGRAPSPCPVDVDLFIRLRGPTR